MRMPKPVTFAVLANAFCKITRTSSSMERPCRAASTRSWAFTPSSKLRIVSVAIPGSSLLSLTAMLAWIGDRLVTNRFRRSPDLFRCVRNVLFQDRFSGRCLHRSMLARPPRAAVFPAMVKSASPFVSLRGCHHVRYLLRYPFRPHRALAARWPLRRQNRGAARVAIGIRVHETSREGGNSLAHCPVASGIRRSPGLLLRVRRFPPATRRALHRSRRLTHQGHRKSHESRREGGRVLAEGIRERSAGTRTRQRIHPLAVSVGRHQYNP